MEVRYLKHDIWERIVHWLMALSVILLIISGLNIRFPGLLPWVTMNTYRFIHFVSMYVLIFSWIFHIYHTLFVEFKTETIRWRDIKGIPGVLKYYLFVTDTLPPYEKYNPLQKFTYNLVWILILVQVLTGLALYWPKALPWLVDAFGGLMVARTLHDFMNYIFIVYLIVHVYLILTEDIRALWAMFHGYYYRQVTSR